MLSRAWPVQIICTLAGIVDHRGRVPYGPRQPNDTDGDADRKDQGYDTACDTEWTPITPFGSVIRGELSASLVASRITDMPDGICRSFLLH